jgi:hypothetical protein
MECRQVARKHLPGVYRILWEEIWRDTKKMSVKHCKTSDRIIKIFGEHPKDIYLALARRSWNDVEVSVK